MATSRRPADAEILARAAEPSSTRDPAPFTVTAIIAAYNEGDIIHQVVGDLVRQGISVYLIDHGSTDGTAAAAEPHLGRGLMAIERFAPRPSEAPEDGRVSWEGVLRRKEELAAELDADWFIHHDADEFRESPWPHLDLREAIRQVDLFGYNAIDFELLNFWPTHDAFRAGDDVRAAFPFYEPGAAHDKVQIRCWKKGPTPVELAASGGHEAVFPARSVFPLRFVLRHYPIRGQAHGKRKVFDERRARFLESEHARGWHLQYDAVQEGQSFLRDASTLTAYDPAAVRLQLVLNHRGVEDLRQTPAARQRARTEAQRELERLGCELDRRNREVERLGSELDARNRDHDRVARELETSARELDQRNVEVRRLGVELDGQNREVERLRQELAGRNREIDERNRELGQAALELDQRNREADRLGRDLDRQNREVERLGRQLDQRNRDMAQEALELDQRNREAERLGLDLDRQNREAERLAGELDQRNHELARITLEVHERNRELERLGVDLDRQNREVERLGIDLDRRNREVERLGVDLDRRNREAERLSLDLDRRNREGERLAEVLDQRNREADHLRQDLDSHRREVLGLEQQLAEVRGRAEQLVVRLETAEAAAAEGARLLQAVHASRSWRWSAPLRAVSRAISGRRRA